MQWLKEGDHNTKFFHMMALARRSINGIHNLRMDEERVVSREDLNEHVEEYFHSLFKENWLVRPKLNGLHMPQLGEDQAA